MAAEVINSISLYVNKGNKNFNECQLKPIETFVIQKINGEEACNYSQSEFSSEESFYSWMYHEKNEEIRWEELAGEIIADYNEHDFVNDVVSMDFTTDNECILEFSRVDDDREYVWLKGFHRKHRNLSAFHAGLKILIPENIIKEAYTDIEQLFRDYDKCVVNISAIFMEKNYLEVRYEFKKDIEFEETLKLIKKKYPSIRLIAITDYQKWEDRKLHISGSGSKKVNKKNIRYQGSWDSEYNHITSASEYWDSQMFYEPDYKFRNTELGIELSFTNMFAWNEHLDLSDLYEEINISTIGKRAFIKNKHLKSIKAPKEMMYIGKLAFSDCKSLMKVDLAFVKKVDESAFEGCKKLKEVSFSSPKEDVDIAQNAFPDEIDILFKFK